DAAHPEKYAAGKEDRSHGRSNSPLHSKWNNKITQEEPGLYTPELHQLKQPQGQDRNPLVGYPKSTPEPPKRSNSSMRYQIPTKPESGNAGKRATRIILKSSTHQRGWNLIIFPGELPKPPKQDKDWGMTTKTRRLRFSGLDKWKKDVLNKRTEKSIRLRKIDPNT
ncbi:hypothetical protein C922_05299, partial [Plasmodium inui San Antonio 1]